MSGTVILEMVKFQHASFAKAYRAHGAEVETAWLSLEAQARARCIRQAEQQGHTVLGVLVPNRDLSTITDTEAEYLLEHFKHRATTSLYYQHCHGINGQPGDYYLTLQLVHNHGPPPVDPTSKDC